MDTRQWVLFFRRMYIVQLLKSNNFYQFLLVCSYLFLFKRCDCVGQAAPRKTSITLYYSNVFKTVLLHCSLMCLKLLQCVQHCCNVFSQGDSVSLESPPNKCGRTVTSLSTKAVELGQDDNMPPMGFVLWVRGETRMSVPSFSPK